MQVTLVTVVDGEPASPMTARPSGRWRP